MIRRLGWLWLSVWAVSCINHSSNTSASAPDEPEPRLASYQGEKTHTDFMTVTTMNGEHRSFQAWSAELPSPQQSILSELKLRQIAKQVAGGYPGYYDQSADYLLLKDKVRRMLSQQTGYKHRKKYVAHLKTSLSFNKLNNELHRKLKAFTKGYPAHEYVMVDLSTRQEKKDRLLQAKLLQAYYEAILNHPERNQDQVSEYRYYLLEELYSYVYYTHYGFPGLMLAGPEHLILSCHQQYEFSQRLGRVQGRINELESALATIDRHTQIPLPAGHSQKLQKTKMRFHELEQRWQALLAEMDTNTHYVAYSSALNQAIIAELQAATSDSQATFQVCEVSSVSTEPDPSVLTPPL